ncbi:hypothetical protein BDY19DRAFT_988468 [Irpex rosettiformis]|uniref:Uncharacterized protein n=1 Tax=Irpex rosettiformis TaxID=378272 RepID=A0ACB8UKK8_9APHY|nr:hypothetical protein BDY19DRAFT_988468 [Irpex rosettiformis]
MDHYLSPQPLASAGLNISTPRPLRPHVVDESTTTSTSNTPATTWQYALPRQHAPVLPHSGTPMFGARHELPADELGVLQSLQSPQEGDMAGREQSRAETVNSSEYRGSWMGRGFLGALMRGLGKTRKAMEKHHSRQSLYEEYTAEAQAAALRNSQMSPGGRTLEGIPESVQEEMVESQRGHQSSQDTYNDGTTAVAHNPNWPQPVWPNLNFPVYSSSQVASQYSVRESSLGPLPPEDTWAYYYARIVYFLIWLRDLPWSEERIVSDFVPARDGRGGFGKERPVNKWYRPKNKQVLSDKEKLTSSLSPPMVLVVPATPPYGSNGSYGFSGGPVFPSLPSVGPPVLPTPVLPSPLLDSATAIRPTHTPRSATSAGPSLMSPGMSSQGAGRQELTYSWYSGQTQPWLSHFPRFAPPQTQTPSRLGSTDVYSSDGRYIDR